MKAIGISLNLLLGLPLLVLLFSMTGRADYAKVVIEGPIFFEDVALLLMCSIGPIVIGGLILLDPPINRGSLVFIAMAALSGYLTYYSLPSVREDRVLRNVVELEEAIEALQDNKDDFAGHMDYYRHRMAELRMFHGMFNSQFEFLINASRIEDKRANRVPIFFALLAGWCVVNAIWLEALQKKEPMAPPTDQW